MPRIVQILMLLHALEADVFHGFDEIQKRVNSEHVRGKPLSVECEALVDKAKALEARVAKLEGEHCGLQEEVCTLGGSQADLETKVRAERELSHSVT